MRVVVVSSVGGGEMFGLTGWRRMSDYTNEYHGRSLAGRVFRHVTGHPDAGSTSHERFG